MNPHEPNKTKGHFSIFSSCMPIPLAQLENEFDSDHSVKVIP